MHKIINQITKELECYENKAKYKELSYDDIKSIKLLLKTNKMLEEFNQEYEDYERESYPNSHDRHNSEMIDYSLWGNSLHNEDGTKGWHWSIAETTEVGKNAGVVFENISEKDWHMALNMAYSDYSKIAKKYGIDNVNFYIDIAKQFLWDSDTIQGKEKLDKYYKYIVKH